MRDLIRFAFPPQIGRAEYLIRLLVCDLAIGYFLVFQDATEPRIALTALALWHYAAFFVIWPRLRDGGMKGIWAVLSLIPLVFVGLSVALIFRPPEFQWTRQSI